MVAAPRPADANVTYVFAPRCGDRLEIEYIETDARAGIATYRVRLRSRHASTLNGVVRMEGGMADRITPNSFVLAPMSSRLFTIGSSAYSVDVPALAGIYLLRTIQVTCR